jgi:RNA polymerase sigma factor (sigma-70 family)
MSESTMDKPPVIDALRRLAGRGPDDSSDAELLARFVESRDGSAFEALVKRHGRLVWGACRRRLRDSHSAEDAFQATFLALSRHASTVRRPEALAAWLHRVAVRCTADLRPSRYHMSASFLDIPARGLDPFAAVVAQDLAQLIDSEIDALPEPFRVAFVLCEVEQRTAADAALSLGCPVGTIESRLTRARKWLRARLTRRGVTVGSLTCGFLATDTVPVSARAGAVALATGAAPLPTGLVALADRAVRMGLKSLTLGVGLASGVALACVGGLIWVLTQTVAPIGSFNRPEVSGASADLEVPAQRRFRRSPDSLPLPPEVIARVGDAWLRHGAIPHRMAFSADGRYLATAGAGDHWLRVWDLGTNRAKAQFWLEDGEFPAAIALSSNGELLRVLVGTGDARTAQLRDFDTKRGVENRRRLLAGGPFTFSTFAHDGQLLGVTTGGLVRMYDAARAVEIWRRDVALPVNRVEIAFAPDRHVLAAVASGSEVVRILDAETGTLKCEIFDRNGSLSMPALSADGRRLTAWCATTHRIRVWDVAKRELVKTASPRCMVSGLCLAPDGKTVVAISAVPVVVPIETDGEPRFLNCVFGGMSGRFSPDGVTLAVASQAMAVQLLDVKSASSQPASPKDVLSPWPVVFADNGERLLAGGFQSWTDYPLREGEAPRRLSPGHGEHEKVLFSASDRAAVSPDRSLIARCTAGKEEKSDCTIDLLDAQTQESRGKIEPGQLAFHPAFSSDGKVLFAITADRYVRGWNVENHEEVMHTVLPLAYPVSACSSKLLISPDSKYLGVAQMAATTGLKSDTIRVYDAHTGEQKFAGVAAVGVPRMAFSLDGKLFAAVTVSRDSRLGVSELSIWETTTGTLKSGLPALDGQPAFSPDGRTIAVTHDNGVLLIELATGRARHEFRHFGKVEPALAWRADGRVLASASSEAPIYLWDVVGDRTGVPAKWDPALDNSRWANLCETDATIAFRSLRQLASHPSEAVAFLKARVVPPGDARLASRVCEALELIGTREARELLVFWAEDEKESPLSCEASNSLRRLTHI